MRAAQGSVALHPNQDKADKLLLLCQMRTHFTSDDLSLSGFSFRFADKIPITTMPIRTKSEKSAKHTAAGYWLKKVSKRRNKDSNLFI